MRLARSRSRSFRGALRAWWGLSPALSAWYPRWPAGIKPAAHGACASVPHDRRACTAPRLEAHARSWLLHGEHSRRMMGRQSMPTSCRGDAGGACERTGSPMAARRDKSHRSSCSPQAHCTGLPAFAGESFRQPTRSRSTANVIPARRNPYSSNAPTPLEHPRRDGRSDVSPRPSRVATPGVNPCAGGELRWRGAGACRDRRLCL